MSRLDRNKFKFRRNENIGNEGAEQDSEFLFECFVDTGDLDILRNTENPKCIVVGRTGAGKTALLLQLREAEENVVWLEPDHLALSYLSNSTILKYLEDLGVKLDIFYRLLWRHILSVELIKIKYNIRTEKDQKNFLNRITRLFFGDKKKQDALNYLIEWGEKFWEDTEYRIHEVTEKLENDIKAAVGTKAKFLEARVSGNDKISSEDRYEIVHRAQDVINRVQIRKLSRVNDILANDIFSDQYPKFFIVIDRLDESWVEDTLRYRLIRSLIECLKDLQKFRSVKIIIALRQDLLYRVFRETRDSGFQEEKYQPLILRIKWDANQLIEILNKRLNSLVQRQYTKEPISWKDLFPKSIGKEDTKTYIVKRTMYRPRDIIQFTNLSIEMAVDRPAITATIIREAEGHYSTLRFRSLGDEWFADYPNLLKVSDILKRRQRLFPLIEIKLGDIEDLCIDSFDKNTYSDRGKLCKWADQVYNGQMTVEMFRLRIVKMFYETGIVGIKKGPSSKTSWSFLNGDIIREAEINEDAKLEICPVFYRVLGTVLR